MYAITTRERTFTLVGILVGLFLGALDQTIVGTAMPKILQSLKGLNLYTWVFTSYLLASTAMIPIYGKLSDLYGRKIIILAGILIFLAGSVLSGQSRSMVELIAFRALQGLGSAGIFSSAFTVVADIFPPTERGKYQGLFGAVFGIASVVGPWLGGLLTDTLSWRWVFYVNIPLGLVAVLFIIFQMPPLRPDVKKKITIDWWGSFLLLVAVVPILLALSLGGTEFPWSSWQIVSLFALGAVGIALFIWVETRAAEPILPFDMFGNRTYVIGNIAALLIAGIAFFGAVLFLPVFMVLVVGASASQAGLTITPLVLGMVVGSFLSGQLVSRLKRYKAVILVGIALVFVGYLLMHAITVTTTRAEMTWRMIVLGFGMGPALPVITLAIQNAVNPREMGAATSSSQFFRQIGSTLGVAVFGTLLATTLSEKLPSYLPAEMRQVNMSSAQFNMAQLQSGDVSGVGDEIKSSFQDIYAKVERALTGDQQAARGIMDDPRLPQQLKDEVGKGGIAAEVKAGLDAQLAAVSGALRSGKPGAVQALLADPRLPPQIKARLEGIPPAMLANPQAVSGIIDGLARSLREAEPALIKTATDSALLQIKQSLDAQATAVTTEVTTALKKAFTDAIVKVYFWGILIVALGFIVALFLPENELRSHSHASVTKDGAATGSPSVSPTHGTSAVFESHGPGADGDGRRPVPAEDQSAPPEKVR